MPTRRHRRVLTVQSPLPLRALKPLIALAVALTLAVGGAGGAAAEARTGWAFSALRVPEDRPLGQGVEIAVIDSGIDAGHPAFAGRIAASVDCVGSGGDVRKCSGKGVDHNGHGTHIAGIIAARPVNGGPQGIAPGAEILAVRALSNTCDGKGDARECRALGELADVVAGVRWATARRVDVINLSIDAGVDLDWRSGELADAIADAWAAGAVVVASAGNRAATVDDPAIAAVPLVLVGAITPEGSVADYSNVPVSARWSVMAPGGEAGGACPTSAVLSTYPRTIEAAGTGCLSGTSMAAAYVSGALASLISTGLDAHEALAHLLATSAPSAELTAPVPDLARALSTPPKAIDPAFYDGLPAQATASANPRAAVAEPGPSSASDWPEWTRVHPIRARVLATALLFGLVVFAAVLGRRARDRSSWAIGY